MIPNNRGSPLIYKIRLLRLPPGATEASCAFCAVKESSLKLIVLVGAIISPPFFYVLFFETYNLTFRAHSWLGLGGPFGVPQIKSRSVVCKVRALPSVLLLCTHTTPIFMTFFKGLFYFIVTGSFFSSIFLLQHLLRKQSRFVYVERHFPWDS